MSLSYDLNALEYERSAGLADTIAWKTHFPKNCDTFGANYDGFRGYRFSLNESQSTRQESILNP